MRKIFAFTAALTMAVLLSACGQGAQSDGEVQSEAGTFESPAEPAGQEGGRADESTADAGALPFDITGEYAAFEESGEGMFVEAVSGGYVITFGGNVSQTLSAEYDKELNQVRLAGSAAMINGQPLSDGENWHVAAALYPVDENDRAGGNVTFMNVATNDESTRISDTFSRIVIRPGVYSYWNTKWAADGSGYDWKNAALTECMTLEYGKGLFRFTFADGYTSDWVSPTSKSMPRYEFMEIAVTGSGKEATTANIYLEDAGIYSFADVNIYTPDKSAYLLEAGKACSPLDEGYSLDYTGTYELASDAPQKNTIVVEKNSLTVDGRYTLEFTLEDLVMRWRPLGITDTETGETEQASLYIGDRGEGMTCTLTTSSGSLQISEARKE